MKRWRIPRTPRTLSAELVSALLAGIGTDAFAAQLMRALQPRLPMTFCTVYVIGGDGRIDALSAASSYGRAAEDTVARYLAQRFDRMDPHMLWLAQRPRPQRATQLWLGHHAADELSDAAYRAACYGDVGIRERLSVLSLSPEGQRTAVNFYRSLALPPFGDTDREQLQAHAALLAEATATHARLRPLPQLAPARPTNMPLLALSSREREVIHLLRTGLSAAAGAQALGIALPTFRTHQYRAFRRLGVRTVHELLVALPPAR